MNLTKDEENMLSGKEGEAYRQAMDILVKMGEYVGAKRMVPVSWADLTAFSGNAGGHGDNPYNDYKKWTEDYEDLCIEEGVKFKCPLTLADVRTPEKNEKMEKMGAKFVSATGASTPHDYWPLPLFGQIIAAGATNVNTYCNGALGARGNNEGPTGIRMAAVTGVTPEYDYLLDEFRLGKIQIDVNIRPANYVEWQVLGSWVSWTLGTHWWDIPVFAGVNPLGVSNDDIISFCGTLNNPGSMTHWLMPGISPEARTLEQAFGGEKPKDRISFGREELNSIFDKYPRTGKNPDVVEIRFPVTVDRLYKLAKMVKGKKVHKNIEAFSVDLTVAAKLTAERYGFKPILEMAGIYLGETQGRVNWRGKIIDPWTNAKRAGIETIVTDSPKNCYGMGNQDIDMVLMPSFEKCIQVALTGSMEV